MKKEKTLEERITFIRGLHRRLDVKLEEANSSKRVTELFEDQELQNGLNSLAREQKTTVHKVKLSVLTPFLSEIDNSGFLQSDVSYVDWCSGRGFLTHLIAHSFGASVTMVDVRFPRNYILERHFPCVLGYEIPRVKFDLTSLRDDKHPTQIPENTNDRIAYIGMHCCGSLPDLIVRYAQLQSRMPDFIAILTCHHEKMDFELSTLASKIKIDDEKLFALVKRVVAHLKYYDGYHPVARKAMEIIDYLRAENLQRMGYEARVVRIYHPNVSPFNHMVIGIRR